MKNCKDVMTLKLELNESFRTYLKAVDLRMEDEIEFKRKFAQLMDKINSRVNYLHPHS